MKKSVMVGIMVLVLSICFVALPVKPSFACDFDFGIEGSNWGNFNLATSENEISFGVNTGSSVSGYVHGSPPGNANLSWEGGVQIETNMDFGNLQVYSNTWHCTNVSINIDP